MSSATWSCLRWIIDGRHQALHVPVEHARKAKSINNGFISRLALSLDEYPGMKLYWRAGHSAILHPADLCSRALTKYDGSQTPEQNGFDGPWQYRDCPVFNVLFPQECVLRGEREYVRVVRSRGW